MDSGGRQWRDSVDIDLVVATVRYLVDSSVQGAIIVYFFKSLTFIFQRFFFLDMKKFVMFITEL